MSLRNRKSNSVNAMWKHLFVILPLIGILCYSGYKPYEHRDMERNNVPLPTSEQLEDM